MATMYARSTLTVWDNATTGGWSNTSGGASNGTVPNSTTDVVFDANSGASRNITLSTGATCNTLNTTGAAAMTFISGALSPSSNINLTGSVSINDVEFQNAASASITSGGATIGILSFNSTGAITLGDDLIVTAAMNGLNKNFDAQNHNVTVPGVSFGGGAIMTLTMGSGTWTLTGDNPWPGPGVSVTIVPGTSTIKLTGNSAANKQFVGGGKTYNNFWNATRGSGTVTITGANTFNNFRIDAGRTQIFPISTTNTIASLTADGTGNQISIQSSSAGSAATLAKSGGGSIYVDYCAIEDIVGSPAATWNARNSTNVSGNSGITFIPGNYNFLQFF